MYAACTALRTFWYNWIGSHTLNESITTTNIRLHWQVILNVPAMFCLPKSSLATRWHTQRLWHQKDLSYASDAIYSVATLSCNSPPHCTRGDIGYKTYPATTLPPSLIRFSGGSPPIHRRSKLKWATLHRNSLGKPRWATELLKKWPNGPAFVSYSDKEQAYVSCSTSDLMGQLLWVAPDLWINLIGLLRHGASLRELL